MPNASKNTVPSPPAKTGSISFEDALNKLKATLEAMESEDLPLESLLTKYEEGVRLAKVCQDKLTEAELKIQQVEKNTAGEIKLRPLASPENATD